MEEGISRSERIKRDQSIPGEKITNANVENTSKGQSNPIGLYRFGRTKICIPLSKEMLDEKIIGKYLPTILSKHQKNVSDYNHLHDVYCGKQHIWQKQRPYQTNKENYVVVENHAFAQVEFKKGYMFGNDVKYSCADDSASTDDISWLNKYMKDQKKAKKNVDLAEDIYKAGVGRRMILPKSNQNYDIRRNAPFDIYNLDFNSSFVVYSSNYTHEKLFGGVITQIDSKNPNEEKYELMIYDHQYSYRYMCGSDGIYLINPKFIDKYRHYVGMPLIVEYTLNKSQIGIIEVVETIHDAINTISSNTVDNVADIVNSLLVFYNMEATADDIRELLAAGGINANNDNPQKQADVKYLVNALNNTDVNTKYESLVTLEYDLVGVPRASTTITSGGDTGQARLLGGGWSRADVVASQDEISLKEGEMEMLEICIAICEKHPDCPINEIYPCDIEINFNRNKNDNLLVKTQSLQNLIGMNMPKETALNIVGVTANPHEVAAEWETHVEEKENRDLQKENTEKIDK